MEVYSSIEELSAASDLVILGTVEGGAAREVDYGTADPDERQVTCPRSLYHLLC